MDHKTINGSINIKAGASRVWDVLTNPEMVVRYTGSMLETDWQEGSAITWSGEMHGTKYQNRGKVLENVPDTLLRFTYWSGMGGDADLPENYSEIIYRLIPSDDDHITLSYRRINIPTALEQQIFEANLSNMLEEIKKLSEQ